MKEHDTELYNLEQAIEILKPWINEQGNICASGAFVSYIKGHDMALLDDEFTADELEALAVYMRESKKENK